MKKNLKDFAEKSLKSFLKKKKIGFTAALLTTFLITGGIGLASSAQLSIQTQATQEALLANIAAQKAEIMALLEENERAIKEAQERHHVLLRQADYYSKPVYPSTQVFFTFGYESSGKMKNVTRKEFAHDINIVKNYIEATVTRGASGFSGISGLSDELADAYLDGYISAERLAELLLVSGNGSVSVAMPNSVEVDLGVNIVPLNPSIPVVSKTVDVSVDVPSIPQVTVSVPTPNVPTFPAVTATPPTMGTITAPSVSVSVEKPEAVSPITVGSVNPASPNSVSLSAPSVSVTITPPSITPTMAQPPVVPNAPAIMNINVTPTGPGVFTAPASITAPTAPTAPVVSVLTPPSITYQVGGFGQDVTVQFNGGQGIAAMNWATYNSSGLNITTNGTGAGTSWSGAMTTIATGGGTGTLPASFTPGSLRAFISDVLDHNVTINGTYTFHSTAPGTHFPMFISYNPYEVGRTTAADKTLDFTGTLTLDGNGGIGMEHQLLAGGGSGAVAVANVNNGTTTTIMRNSGTIIMAPTGQRLVGMVIDTEYFGSASNNWFRKSPSTRNDGTIIINSTNSVGIDFGYYDSHNTPGNYGPNSNVFIGNIQVNGTGNYGYRQRYYGNSGGDQFYYDAGTSTGSNGVVAVAGSGNVGISIAQGMSSGNPISNMSGLQITVGGNNNVGFLRNSDNSPSNSGAMLLNSTSVGTTFGFVAGATNSALIRSDVYEIILSRSLNLTAGSTGNAALQAGATGTVTLASGTTLTSSLPTFYGMTAGNFTGSTGARANNNGTITLSGANGIGMAIAAGNTGANSGNITVSGSGSTGIYNLGATNSTGGTITAGGANSAAVYHAGGTTTLTNTSIVANGGSTTGIFNDAASGLSFGTGSTVSATGISGGTSAGVYNPSGRTISLSGIPITANSYATGLYNAGTATIDGTVTAAGANSTAGIYNTGALTLNGLTINLTGSGTGLYHAASATLTATGTNLINVTGSGSAGVFNAGTIATLNIPTTVTGGSSVGVYNDGSITTLSGAVNVTGTLGNVSVGIRNNAGATIGDVTGNVTAGNEATAIHNAGTMTVSGTVIANGTASSTGIYNTGAGALTLAAGINITVAVGAANATGIYNDSTSGLTFGGGTITVSGSSSAGLYNATNGIFFVTGGVINTGGSQNAGIFNNTTSSGAFTMSGGTITATGNGTNGSVGIYNQGGASTFTLNGTAEVYALNFESTGVYNEGTFNKGGTSLVNVTGDSATGIYNSGVSANLNVSGGITTITGRQSSAIYSDLGSTINFTGNSTINANQGATGIYVAGGTVTTSSATTTINVNNTIPSGNPGHGEGVGVFASFDGTTGSNVNLSGSNIIVSGGSSAVASYGTAGGITTLNLTGATVDYDGEGFAVYSNGEDGLINLTNATLHLRGNATGVEVDYSSGTSPITFNNTDIEIWSNNVTLASLKDYTTSLLVSSLSGGIGSALGTGVTVNDNGNTNYTLARIDGGVLSIDTNISKTSAIGTPGYDYYRRFQGQRLKTTVETGVTVTAEMTTAQAGAGFGNQVIGIESNSSTNAVTASETTVELRNNSKIVVARTDASGDGAVGIFSNYGEVTLDSGSGIEVQNGYSGTSDGVGIYAVNGSKVENSGDITVAGNGAVGILSMGYREVGGTPVGPEFGGTASGQGTQNVINKKNITMENAGSIGIYGKNNTTGVVTGADSVLRNESTGTVKVASGTSSTNMSIGIYGEADTSNGITIESSGTIEVGDYAVGIYGQNAVVQGANTPDLGTIKIGGNSVAIMGNGSTLASSITGVAIESSNTTDDKIGIMFSTGAASNINFNINGANFTKGTAIYLDNVTTNFTYQGGNTINVGAGGVGIYMSTLGMTATNAGTIDLLSGSTTAVGMYTDDGIIENTGTIAINGVSGQVGMFASGASSFVDNGGTISLNAANGTGIYLENGATLTASGTVTFGSTDGIGILLDGATADIGGLSIASNNVSGNILVFGQDTGGVVSTVTNSGTVTVNGLVLPPPASAKTIGVYLQRNSLQNEYTGGTMNVLNGALGIYSQGNNKISNASVVATGNETVGIYLDGPSELDGVTVTAN